MSSLTMGVSVAARAGAAERELLVVKAARYVVEAFHEEDAAGSAGLSERSAKHDLACGVGAAAEVLGLCSGVVEFMDDVYAKVVALLNGAQ
jgi:hypothetical protein